MIREARRRCILSTVSLTIAWVLFHGYVAAMVWARGDEFLRQGNPAVAERYYRRALAFDPESRDALDRLLFAAVELKEKRDLIAAIADGDRYLKRHPDAVEIRTGRALALFAARRNDAAATDFHWLGRHLHDERFLRLASHAEARAAEGNRL